MFCPSCGTENREGAKLCKKCRYPLSEAAQRLCPNGHPLNEGSEECEWCNSGTQKIRIPAMEASANLGHGATTIEDSSAEPAGNGGEDVRNTRRTVFRTPDDPPERTSARKIVGVLITYTWRKEGEMFPLREGRNLVGRDASQCDVSIPHDRAMSNVHAHITFRKNFVVGDMVTVNGTFVNDEPVEQQFHPLPDHATMRTGATIWKFVAIPWGDDKLSGQATPTEPVS